jgi:hypothetical protein
MGNPKIKPLNVQYKTIDDKIEMKIYISKILRNFHLLNFPRKIQYCTQIGHMAELNES